jgi:hypothetical protein
MRVLRTVEVNLKIRNRSRAQKVLNDVDAEVADHRGVMIWIEPTPVGRSSVIVVQNPLGPFEILFQHFFLFGLALLGFDVEFYLGLVVVLLGKLDVLVVEIYKLCHEFQVIVFRLLLELSKSSGETLSCVLLETFVGGLDVADLVIRNLLRLKVRQVTVFDFFNKVDRFNFTISTLLLTGNFKLGQDCSTFNFLVLGQILIIFSEHLSEKVAFIFFCVTLDFELFDFRNLFLEQLVLEAVLSGDVASYKFTLVFNN